MEYSDGLKVCVDEMNRNLKLQYEGIDSLKATARAVLSAASLITALMTVLQLARPAIQAAYVPLYNAGIVITMMLYAGLISACVAAISSVTMIAPIGADWKALYTTFATKTETDLLKMQIAQTIQAIEKNEPIINRLRTLVIAACILLPVVVVILLALSLIPR
jgi:hypothetical protein